MYRRDFLFMLPALAALPANALPDDDRISGELARLEKQSGGRLGVSLYTPRSGCQRGHRLDERFALCSTFKLPLAGLILREIDRGNLSKNQWITFSENNMVPFAPVTEKHLADGGMSVIELAEAIQVRSDNVAANLLLNLIGGPPGFTSMLRQLGDDETRLDRYEPDLNFVPNGEPRDTTTPRAMAQTVSRFVFGDELEAPSRHLLTGWTRDTKTGSRRIRAGLPANWKAGDKTGTAYAPGMANKHNDIAVAWPDEPEALAIAGYFEANGEYSEIRAIDDAVLAEVGRIVASNY